MVTRADVAARARTSTAVVSYVINNGPRPVAAHTRQRVLDAIADLNYRPNRVAQALRGRQSHVLGLIVPDISNPFYAELARTIENEAESRGYTLVFGNSEQSAERELQYVRAFLDRKVDGLFIISGSNSSELSALASELHTPYILLDRRLNYTGETNFFGVDGIAGACMATRHLISLGHVRIVGLCGPAHLGVDRATGYRRAMEDAGLAADIRYAERFERLAAYEAARTILEGPSPPSAIFASNDVAAISVLRAAADLGLALPDDLAVVGFDDIQEGKYSIPRLTTVAQPTVELGQVATSHLIDLIESESGHETHSTVRLIKPQLIIRESCGKSKL
jgi:LacI family transcriptional regulator